MATSSNIESRLRRPARWLLYVAAVMARLQMKLPHRWVIAVTNRSWQIRVNGSPWRSVRIDNSGKVVN